MDTTCFDAMSEHIDWQWTKGSGDKLQPKFLAWSLSPKLCLMKAAVTSVHGTYSMIPRPGGPLCSVPMPELPTLPPSDHPQCTGHGFFFPRIGHVEGPATNTAALLVAARMKSLASEVFLSTPNSPLEKWQGILPNETTCFKEGQQMTILEPFKQVTEKGRLMGAPPKGYLFAVWKKVSCCVDIPQVAQAKLYLEIIKQTCNVFGG